MAHARKDHHWQQTSLLASILVNINRKKDSPAVPVDYFNPLKRQKKKPEEPKIKVPISALKVFIKND